MPKQLPEKKDEKIGLHPRNKHRFSYPFQALIDVLPELKHHVFTNLYQTETIDFADPTAVLLLNKALLSYFYGIKNWEIPKGYLCPPIPGRADYIHHIADLLSINGEVIHGPQISCLDIGTGANCIYPLIGHASYGWNFVGTDIDAKAIESAKNIVDSNPDLKEHIQLRWQQNSHDIFKHVVGRDEKFEACICNPPFHASAKEATARTYRKLHHLSQKPVKKIVLNFGGQPNELWCKGGEIEFVKNMIVQSKALAHQCLWFSTLISKQTNIDKALAILKSVESTEVKIIPMAHGNKTSRIIAWTFLSTENKKKWLEGRICAGSIK
jgi:23S rRNA (adenine1618-N6)-methyltransferase